MASSAASTPYTPIFPPPLPKKHHLKSSYSDDEDDVDHSSNSSQASSNHSVPYIQKLKERYLQLASIPYELCVPSGEDNIETRDRIQSIRKKMQERHESRLPFELTLTCVRLAGGDWVGEPLSDIEDDPYILPRTEDEWFQWERRRKAIREKLSADRQAQQRRDDIAKWTENVQVDNISLQGSFVHPPSRLLGTDPASGSLHAELSPPAAPIIEPLHDFNDSISGNSAPSLPFSLSALIDIFAPPTACIPMPSIPFIPSIPTTLPPPIPPTPPSLRPAANTIHVISQPRGTPLRDHQLAGTNPQLSSPISPPRSLRPLTSMTQVSFPVSSKRYRDDQNQNMDGSPYNSLDLVDTPRPQKRFKPADEPITPKSVERRTLSQPSQSRDDAKQLPTLSELMANSKAASKKGSSGRKSIASSSSNSQTPRQDVSLALPDMMFSQVPFAMFIPQAQSTQIRGFDLEPDEIVEVL